MPDRCRVCAAPLPAAFFRLDRMPVFCNVLSDTRRDARALPRGDVDLALCPGCGLIQNVAFDAARLCYDGRYENSLHFSPRFRDWAGRLATRLVDRYGLRGGRVVEIGCGNGEFLSLLCEAGASQGLGFDPSGVAERAAQGSEHVRIVAGPLPEGTALSADLLCCRHVLEHVGDPLGFLRGLRDSLGGRPDCALYFEVPNGRWILEEADLWDVVYEHFAYYTEESLVALFERAGFEVLDVGESFGRQFLGIEARRAAAPREVPVASEALAARVGAFATRCAERVAAWRGTLDALAEDGRRAAVWGAGSKGVTFLNVLSDRAALGTVIDINPHKVGRYTAGTGHRISAPEALLAERAPALVVAMNPNYLLEIREALAARGLRPELRAA